MSATLSFEFKSVSIRAHSETTDKGIATDDNFSSCLTFDTDDDD